MTVIELRPATTADGEFCFRLHKAAMGAFVDQATQDGFPADVLSIDAGHGGAGSVRFVAGDTLGDALVRPGRVVVHLVLGQDGV